MTLISNVRYQKKRNESDIKMDFQNLVLFMMIGTKSSRSWGLLRNIFAIFINLSIFVWEYRTRRPVIPHVNERYVTKPQTSHNTMQKTRPRYLNLERFYWGSVFARQKNPLCIILLFRNEAENVFFKTYEIVDNLMVLTIGDSFGHVSLVK